MTYSVKYGNLEKFMNSENLEKGEQNGMTDGKRKSAAFAAVLSNYFLWSAGDGKDIFCYGNVG